MGRFASITLFNFKLNMIVSFKRSKYLKKNLSRGKFLTFSFVRHPFDRLVSAFVEKVESKDSNYIKLTLLDLYGSCDFETFLKHVLSTFQEASSASIDRHWQTFQARCAYCDLDYDVIGRIETFAQDSTYIFLRANLTSVLSLDSASDETHGIASAESKYSLDGSPGNRTLAYFRPINKTLLAELYHIYKVDMDLFQYNMNGLI